jgi:hypothetical protein
MPRRLAPPLRGAANNTTTLDTPELFCPQENLRNVRVFGSDPVNRPRFGPRPSLSKAFQTQLGQGAKVQALAVVGRASGVSGYEAGTSNALGAGVSVEAGPISGSLWVLDAQRGIRGNFGAGTLYGGFSLEWHPTLKRCAFVSIVPVSGKIGSRVRMIDFDPTSATFQTALWTTDLLDQDPGGALGSFDIYANSVAVGDVFTFVAAGPWVFVLRTSDGTYLKRFNLFGWAEEAMRAIVRPDGRLAVAFRGSNVVTGPVTTMIADTGNGNGEGSHFRAGVMLFDVDSTKTAVNDTMLALLQYGAKKDGAYTYYEDHTYFRLSEHIASQPRGKYVNSIAAGSDSSLFLATCNKGWGPNSTFAPDSSVAARAVAKISAGTTTAALAWETDFTSRTDPYSGSWGTYYNDIPTPANADNSPTDPHPTADAIAVDPSGDIYVGGRKNQSDYAIHKLRGSDGAPIWQTNVGPVLNQHAIAYNAGTGLLVVGGKRNTSWTGASGNNALVWFIDPATGLIEEGFDLGEAVDCFGVACNASGDTAFVTGYVS